MAKRIVTQFTPADIEDIRARVNALRRTTATQTGEALGAYLERAGISDPKERQRILWAVAVIGYVARHGTRLDDVERFHVWVQDGIGAPIIEVVRPTHRG